MIGTLNLFWSQPYTLTNLQEDIAREVAAQLSIAIRQTQLRETEQRRRKELELLEHISTAMRYADKSEQLFVILANEFKALFNTDASAILIPHDGRMECAFVSGPEEQKERLLGTKEVIEKFSQILFAGKSHFISEQEFDLPGIFSTALLPFLSQQNILGGAVLFWCGRHEFSNEECHLLQTVADVAGIALHRMMVLETLEEQVANRTRDLSALYDVTTVSSQSLNLQEILDQSLRKVLEVMSSGIGVIHLLDEDGETMRLAASQGIPADVVQKINLLAGDDMRIYDVFSHNGVVIIPDLSSDPHVSKLIG